MALSKNKSKSLVSVCVTTEDVSRRPEATVFMAIDTSGSMSGAKIRAVSSAVKDIITQCPPYVRFVVRKFDEKVSTIVSKKKSYLDIARLTTDLTKCGSRTALFDGIGQTINEIPYSYSRLDVIHVLAFTDGEDNASSSFTLDSMVKLLNEKLENGNLQFTFIQAGSDYNVTNALEKHCPTRCTVLKVEDSVKGINMAFAEVKETLRLRFVVNLPSTSSDLSGDLGKLKLSGLSGSAISLNIHKTNDNSYRKKIQNSSRGSHSQSQPHSYQNRYEKRQPRKEIVKTGTEKAKQCDIKTNEKKFDSEPKMTFLIWVGNIPKEAKEKEILDFFSQWGECTMYRMNEWNERACSILSYKEEKARQLAIQYGNGNSFFGSEIKVLKQ